MNEQELRNQITEVIFDRGTLMDIDIGRWAGIKKLRPEDMLLERKIDNNAIYLGHKRLLPKEAMARLQTLDGRARALLEAKSVAFPISGARFVSYNALPGLLSQLQGIKRQWNEAVERLVSKYPEYRTKQLGVLDQQARKLADEELKKAPVEQQPSRSKELEEWVGQQMIKNNQAYPVESDLRSRFRFDWRMFKVSALGGMEEMSTLEQSDIVEAQQQLKADLQKWVRDAAAQMHKTLGEAAKNAKDMLEKNGKLNPRSLRPLFDAFETFKDIDFTGASNFHEVVQQIKRQFAVEEDGGINYERSAELVNGARQQMSSLLGTVAALAVDEAAEEAANAAISKVGEFARFVEVD